MVRPVSNAPEGVLRVTGVAAATVNVGFWSARDVSIWVERVWNLDETLGVFTARLLMIAS